MRYRPKKEAGPVRGAQAPKLALVPPIDPGGRTAALITRLEGHALLKAIFAPDDRVHLARDRIGTANENTGSAQEFLEARNQRLRSSMSLGDFAETSPRSLFLVPVGATVLPLPATVHSRFPWARR